MANFIGQGVFRCSHPIPILATAAIAGEKEGQGPMSACFDRICSDSYFGQTTWEQAEGALQRETVSLVIEKAGLQPEQLDGILAGDLVNQCTSSSYGLRGLEVPFLGIYGACSTMSEGLLLASLLADSGAGRHFIAATSSHFSTAERQFRFPLSYGAQRTPTAQWTCTASGAAVLAATAETETPCITGGCIGRIQDLGVTDANNMGAAMAPAAADTYIRWFQASGTSPADYDAIVTGDLGIIGSNLFLRLTNETGLRCSRHSSGLRSKNVRPRNTGYPCWRFWLWLCRQSVLRSLLSAAGNWNISPYFICCNGCITLSDADSAGRKHPVYQPFSRSARRCFP